MSFFNVPSFEGCRVWITGASSGIGLAVAREFAARGCRVALSARRRETLEELAATFGEGQAIAVPLEVTYPESNRGAAARIAEAFGGLDIAFFSAGICEYHVRGEVDGAIFKRTMDINVTGMAYGIEAALPLLRQSHRPQIVGMSSTAGYRALPQSAAYGASKAAVNYLLASLRVDLLPEQIPVTVVFPGFVRTPMTENNRFSMPFLVDVARASRIIVDGVARQRHEVHFPKALSLGLKALGLLPSPVYTRIIGRLAGER